MTALSRFRFRKVAVVLATLVGGAFVGGDGLVRAANAQGGPPVDQSLIVNTAAQAVPVAVQGTSTVSGSVSVSGGTISVSSGSVAVTGGTIGVSSLPPVLAQQDGTWNVAVAGTPSVQAQQNGPWNVGIAGTPNVAIAGTPTVTVANTAPIPVQMSDSQQLVRFRCLLDPYNATQAQWQDSSCGITVPSGKALVIDYYSYSGGNIAAASIVFRPPTGVSYGADIPIPSGQLNATVAQETRMFASAGDSIEVDMFVAGSGNTSAAVFMYGHYVNQP